MKILALGTTWFAVASLALVLGCTGHKKSGGDGVGNGGDGLALDYRLSAQNGIQRAESNDINMYNLDYKALRQTLGAAKNRDHRGSIES